jgi:hypothetical protein
VAALLAGGAIGGDLALRADRSVAVLTLAHPVIAGHELTAEDLAIAHLSGSGVHAVAATAEGGVIGARVSSNLPAGTVLTAGMLTGAAVPGPGQEILGVNLKAGAYPPGLSPGEYVTVLQVPAADGHGTSQVLVNRAEVIKMVPDPSSGNTVVSLVVSQAQGLTVASAASTGSVVLAALPAGS